MPLDRSITAVPLTILLVEDDAAYLRLAELVLADAARVAEADYRVVTARRLSAGLARLNQGGVDLVLLDLSLPDSQGIATVHAVRAEAPDVPIVVVTSTADERLAAQSLQSGAQDYLIKDEIDARMLARSIRYAMDRHQLQRELVNLSLTDELTGLHNRRGFFTLAERQLKLSRRRGQGLVVVLADLDGLKLINDRFGHAEGDRALIATAQVLMATFRDVDIIARLGGDEFAIVVVDADENLEDALRARLLRQIDARNTREDAGYTLSLSVGTARQPVRKPRTIDDLLARADEALYRVKRASGLARREPRSAAVSVAKP
ncbi:MAG: diguanylate cyclase [Vicinamibacterales bacterium]